MAQTPSQIIEYRSPNLFASSFISKYIEIATERSDNCFFGDNYSLAIALMAMHMYALDSRPGNSGDAGQISSKREGSLSISYSASSNTNSDAYLSQTSYGLELQQLIKTSGPGATVLGAISPFCVC